jgi:predicted nuclease of predicted toxin-antitoxin system
MKLLLDQGLPRSSAALLRERGIDAVHAGESGLATASDQAILEAARLDGRVIVTLDSDFSSAAISDNLSSAKANLRLDPIV